MNYILYAILLFSSWGSNSQIDLEEYYFPIQDLTTPKIYQYVNVKDKNDQFFWKVHFNQSKNELITDTYDEEYFRYNLVIEKFNNQGTEMIEFIDYDNSGSSVKSYKAEIVKSEVFKFDKNLPSEYEVRISSKYGRLTLNKTREFIEFETIEINGTTYDCAKFMEEYKSIYHDRGETYESYKISYYARDLGLVKSYHYTGTKKQEFHLTSIMTNEEFQALKD